MANMPLTKRPIPCTIVIEVEIPEDVLYVKAEKFDGGVVCYRTSRNNPALEQFLSNIKNCLAKVEYYDHAQWSARCDVQLTKKL